MGLNPDVLSFAYADMSSVTSPRRPQKNISLGTERLVQFYSSDPEDLGIEIEHSDDGYVRISSASEDGMFDGTVHMGDIVCEIAGVNMRRPITEHMWKLTTGLMKVAPKPIEVIVAAEQHAPQEGDEETLGAVGNVPEKKADNIDAEIMQTPSLVKQAMSMWQNLNLNGASKEEYHDSPGNGTSDTASMSDGHEGSIVQLPDPYSDPERFGMERNIIFHTESLGIKLHRCPTEGIVQILHVEQNVSKNRDGDEDGRLEVGDVIVEVGGVDLRHKFIGPLEWADMVYFVQNVGRPLDIVIVEDNHHVRERDEDSGAMNNMEQSVEEDAKDVKVENIDVADRDMSIEGEDYETDEEVDQEGSNTGAGEESAEESDETLEEEADEEAIGEETYEELEEEADVEAVEESDETLEGKNEEEELSLYEQADKMYQQEDSNEEENSDAEPEDVMTTLVEQFVATNEKEVTLSLPVENEVSVHGDKIERAQHQIEEKLSQLPKFSPEWFLLKSDLVELRAAGGKVSEVSSQNSVAMLEPSKEDSSIANAPGVTMDQKKSPGSFYFRTHPNNKSSQVTVSPVSVVPSLKDAESSIVSRETDTTSESSQEPPLKPTSIIEEDDVFEVTMWTGPKGPKPTVDKEVAFSSTFDESFFSMDDGDTESPFTGGINFDAPPRIPASALFSQAFIVNRGDGSPLFVVKKTLPNQNKTKKSSYLQMEAPGKITKAKPALDMSEIRLHQDVSLESALSTESAWDTAAFANEIGVQADSCLLDALCGDSMCQGLIDDSSDIRQIKEKANKSRRRRLFGKLRKKKRNDDETKMLGYGSLEEDREDYRSATAALALQKFKGKKIADVSRFCPIDDEVDL